MMRSFLFLLLLGGALAAKEHRHHYEEAPDAGEAVLLQGSPQDQGVTALLSTGYRMGSQMDAMAIGMQIGAVVIGLTLICAVFWFFTDVPGDDLDEDPEKADALFRHNSSASAGESSGPNAEDLKEFEAGDLADYETLVKKMIARGEQQFGPKFKEGAEVHTILKDKVSTFADKAKALALTEINDTCGEVAKVLEAEEFSTMMEWNETIESNFPPLSVLLAGLLVPVNLSTAFVSHLIQIFCTTLPVLVATMAALYMDRNRPCASIPSLKPWAAITAAMALAITFARFALLIRIAQAQSALQAKSAEMRTRLAVAEAGGSNVGWTNVKELFICHSTTLQYATVCEARCRMSTAAHIVGAGTFAWLILTSWNMYLYFAYLFVPGAVAFHVDAAGEPTYCAAWVTACSAKIGLLTAVVFFFLNFFTVINWAISTVFNSESIAQNIAKTAKAFDRANMGIPVAQLLVKVFLMKGSAEILAARFQVAMREKNDLAQEYAEIEGRLMALKAKVDAKEGEVNHMEEQMAATGGGTLESSAMLMSQRGVDIEVMKKKGTEMVESAKASAYKLEEAATDEIEKIVENLQQLMEAVTESEQFKSAKASAEKAAEQAKEAAAQAQEQAQVLAAQAQEQGKILAAQAQEQGAKLAAQAQEQGQAYAAQAQEAAASASASAQAPTQASPKAAPKAEPQSSKAAEGTPKKGKKGRK
eukprot:TRINITY_DN63332_c0_g1_i1.p1 TRINITY_DN63332_c0_g1~~TRINITY_DN63332_c0_g1_i1.p1  ORF type:complete len:703 (-),score=220.14 TRINITY_DN63332_c0_g1_i1:161-2269(-)